MISSSVYTPYARTAIVTSRFHHTKDQARSYHSIDDINPTGRHSAQSLPHRAGQVSDRKTRVDHGWTNSRIPKVWIVAEAAILPSGDDEKPNVRIRPYLGWLGGLKGPREILRLLNHLAVPDCLDCPPHITQRVCSTQSLAWTLVTRRLPTHRTPN